MPNMPGNWGQNRRPKGKPQRRWEDNLISKVICVISWTLPYYLQRDFEVRELREMNKQSTKLVGEATQLNPEIKQAVALYFNQVSDLLRSNSIIVFNACWIMLTLVQASLPLPPTPGETGSASSSRYSSRPSSARSSASTARSGASAVAPKAVTIGADFGMFSACLQ